MEILESIIETLNSNPFAFIAIFVISLLANIIQIYTFIIDRRKLKDEIVEKNKLVKLVETYEYLLNLAQKNIKTEEQLKSVEQQIVAKTDIVGELAQRAEILQKNAQKRLISQVIERNLSTLLETYEDIKELRKEYKKLGDLPNIPGDKKQEIESQINLAVRRPYEFPKSFLFKSVLLVLFIYLIPSPIDTIIVLTFLGTVLEVFFEGVWLFNDINLSRWVYKYRNIIVYGSAYLIWRSVLSFMTSFFIYQPLDLSKTLAEALTVNRILVENIELILSGVAAYFHGRLLLFVSLPKILNNLRTAASNQDNNISSTPSQIRDNNIIDKKQIAIVGFIVILAIGVSYLFSTIQENHSGQIGQNIKTGDIRWNVIGARDLGKSTPSKYGEDQTIAASEDHKFVLVELKIENLGKEYFDINTDNFSVSDNQQRNFSLFPEMYKIVPDDKRCEYLKLNPSATKTCQIVYEIPTDSEGLNILIKYRLSTNNSEKKIIVRLEQ